MANFQYSDIAVAGPVGFVEHINSDGTFVRRIPQDDNLGNPMFITGVSFTAEGELMSVVSVEDNAVDFAPHDIVVLPDQSGYLVIVSRLNNTAILRKYDFDGNITESWDLNVDDGWTVDKTMRLDVLCDNDTVFYTDGMRTVFKFSLASGQQPNHLQLAEDSPYSYNALKVLPNGYIAIAASESGNGPKYALCFDSDTRKMWTDEINPTGDYHVIQRLVADGSEVARYVTRLDEDDNDHQVTALACYVMLCINPGIARYSQSNLTRLWFTRTN